MRVLLFEYISGGGFNQQELPPSLANEGGLMLQALLDNFAQLPAIELTVMLDYRLLGQLNTSAVKQLIIVNPDTRVEAEFARHITNADAVWPIAPEFDGILQQLCGLVAKQNKVLLTSPANAVAVTGDKYQTYLRLSQHQIPTVPTQLAEYADYAEGEWVIKPRDGAGCGDSVILATQQDFTDQPRNDSFIIQPHVQGDKTSLSCLFQHGKAWLLSVNLQGFAIIGQRYQLTEISVNHSADHEKYHLLVEQLAEAFPELWGYVGIDLIETGSAVLVLEINPRLTTSFAALQAALGLNIADLVLQLLEGEPAIYPRQNQSITLKVHS
ncbi:MAG: ATP-dependent carboxylate-amine ligase [Methylobacter sp.]|nr:MAG: ATP-dependent carboxylate-amine ligase [Methylobacter sp.]